MAKRINKVVAAMSTQDDNLEEILARRNVVGVGTGLRIKGGKLTKEICIQVLVAHKQPEPELSSRDLIPPEFVGPDGRKVKTDVLQVGPLTASMFTARYRPVPAGVSIGPEASISAGTLGGWVCDESDDTTVLLTNNHVISNLDTMPALRRVLQPARLDGGVLPADVIGSLKRHVQVNTVPNVPGPPAPVSVVDAAISTIEEDFTYDLRALDVPVAFEVQAPAVEMNVQKVGRTTELTTNGTISAINLTLDIGYGPGSTLKGRIQNSFLIRSTDGNPFSDKGDSGSFVLNQVPGELEGTFPVVGLLYADGFDNTGWPITVANDINAVFGALNLTSACTCIARAIIRAVFGVRSVEVREMRRFLSIKERQLRMFRSRLIQPGRFGRVIEEQITREAARVGKIIGEDEEAFGLLVNALRPLVEQPTNYDIMKTKLDAEMLDNLSRFGSRISRRSPTLRPKVRLGKELLKEIEGNTVEKVLRAADLTFDPGDEPE